MPSPVDPAEVIQRYFGDVVVPDQSYPAGLPPEVAPWYCYLVDGGHSLVVLPAQKVDRNTDPDPVGHAVPVPVKTVLRTGWTVRDGYLVSDIPYDDVLGPITEPGDSEYVTGAASPRRPAQHAELPWSPVGLDDSRVEQITGTLRAFFQERAEAGRLYTMADIGGHTDIPHTDVMPLLLALNSLVETGLLVSGPDAGGAGPTWVLPAP